MRGLFRIIRSIATRADSLRSAETSFGITNGGPVVLPHVYDGRDARSIRAVPGIQAGAGNEPRFWRANGSRAERVRHGDIPGRQHGHAAGTVNPQCDSAGPLIPTTIQPARMLPEPMLRLHKT